MTAEEKLRVVVEGRQSGATVSEVCQRHQVDHAQFYRWERLTWQGALEALRNGAKKASNDRREEWLLTEVNRLCTVVAELIAENLTLKRGNLGLRPHRRYSEEEKKVLLITAARAQEQSDQPLSWILAKLGLTAGEGKGRVAWWTEWLCPASSGRATRGDRSGCSLRQRLYQLRRIRRDRWDDLTKIWESYIISAHRFA